MSIYKIKDIDDFNKQVQIIQDRLQQELNVETTIAFDSVARILDTKIMQSLLTAVIAKINEQEGLSNE